MVNKFLLVNYTVYNECKSITIFFSRWHGYIMFMQNEI